MAKNTSYEDLSKLIIDAIEQEQFFRKDVLVPKVRAIMRGFSLNISATNYKKLPSPNEAAKRLRQLEEREFEVRYWKNLVKSIDPKNMEKYFKEIDIKLEEAGFSKAQSV